MTEPGAAAPSGSLTGRVFAAYGGLRASARGELAAGHTESRLLAWALVIGLLLALPNVLRVIIHPEPDLPADMAVVGNVVAALFFAPLALYGFAALLHLVCLRFAPKTPYRRGRVAFLWSVLVVMPVTLIAETVAIFARFLSPAAEVVALAPSGVFSAWVLALCLAEAHGFRTPWPAFAVLCALGGGLYVLAYGALV